MWLKKEKEGKIYFEFDFGSGKIIQGTKFLNPLDEFKFEKKYGLKQIHSALITNTDFNEEPIGDGIFTMNKNEFIYVKTADCLPCAFIEKKSGILGILHIGWRGTYLKIIERFINKFYLEYSIKPDRWLVVFGQCIDKKDYIIGNDLKILLKSVRMDGLIEEGENIYFDIVSSNLKIIKEYNIKNYYTFPENDKHLFFSHRRGDKGRNIFGGILF